MLSKSSNSRCPLNIGVPRNISDLVIGLPAKIHPADQISITGSTLGTMQKTSGAR